MQEVDEADLDSSVAGGGEQDGLGGVGLQGEGTRSGVVVVDSVEGVAAEVVAVLEAHSVINLPSYLYCSSLLPSPRK